MDPLVSVFIHIIWASVVGFCILVAREWLRRDSSLGRDVEALKARVAAMDLVLKGVRTEVERMNTPARKVNY